MFKMLCVMLVCVCMGCHQDTSTFVKSLDDINQRIDTLEKRPQTDVETIDKRLRDIEYDINILQGEFEILNTLKELTAQLATKQVKHMETTLTIDKDLDRRINEATDFIFKMQVTLKNIQDTQKVLAKEISEAHQTVIIRKK